MTTKKWNTDHIKDQTGRIAAVTGSTSGIGLETAAVLAEKGASVIIAARNPLKADSALASVKTRCPEADIEHMDLDLSDLSSVKRFAEEFMRRYDRLDLLINNAGVMTPPYGKTRDGFELQMGTNHLGHFALTARLFYLLKETPGSRIVNVSSMAHKAGKINFEDLEWETRPYKKWKAYGDSKIANLYFTFALQYRLEKQNSETISAAAHPGWTATDLQRHTGMVSALNPFFSQPPAMGALPTLRAATGEDTKGGDFFGPAGLFEMKGYPRRVKPSRLAMDIGVAEQLFSVSEELTGVTFQ